VPRAAAPGVAAVGADAAGSADHRALARWLELSRRMDGEGLSAEFHRGVAELAAIEFLERRMGPYLQALGDQWARGLLRVSHEHFASERAREFLSSQWRAASEGQRTDRVTAVLATPPGERHALGLHMAAWVIALAGVHVVFLGADTPMDELAFAVARHSARGAVLSVAAGYAGDLPRALSDLEALLPREVRVAVGGAGSRKAGTGENIMNRFVDLYDWAIQLQTTPLSL
jgi:methylmalonyl-CoA mutase cobalamin-binding subunit